MPGLNLHIFVVKDGQLSIALVDGEVSAGHRFYDFYEEVSESLSTLYLFDHLSLVYSVQVQLHEAFYLDGFQTSRADEAIRKHSGRSYGLVPAEEEVYPSLCRVAKLSNRGIPCRTAGRTAGGRESRRICSTGFASRG